MKYHWKRLERCTRSAKKGESINNKHTNMLFQINQYCQLSTAISLKICFRTLSQDSNSPFCHWIKKRKSSITPRVLLKCSHLSKQDLGPHGRQHHQTLLQWRHLPDNHGGDGGHVQTHPHRNLIGRQGGVTSEERDGRRVKWRSGGLHVRLRGQWLWTIDRQCKILFLWCVDVWGSPNER